MPQRKFKTLSPGKIFGLLCVAGLFFLTGCGHGPRLTICVSDPSSSGFQCHGKDGKDFLLKYDASENYIALSPDDAEALFNYVLVCKAKGRGNE